MSRHPVLEKLSDYLNHQITLAELVEWAENVLVEPNFADNEAVDVLMDVLMYVGAADSRGFPLTWEILSDFLDKLGGSVRVIVEVA
jgi:hypothetical protein